nr:MAG TPA: hypothetical protein [Caudoviricetes sp.]
MSKLQARVHRRVTSRQKHKYARSNDCKVKNKTREDQGFPWPFFFTIAPASLN